MATVAAGNGHRPPPRPLPWLVLVRDHPRRPPSAQRHVLACLALRLDWATSTGHASAAELAADASATDRTVRRALSWARTAGLLVQVRRGHRLGNGRTVASVWLLAGPASTRPQRPVEASQPDSRTPPPRPTPKPSRPVNTAGAGSPPGDPRKHRLAPGSRKARPARPKTPIRDGPYLGDVTAELSDRLGATGDEEGTILGMLSNAQHPRAIENKISKDRRDQA